MCGIRGGHCNSYRAWREFRGELRSLAVVRVLLSQGASRCKSSIGVSGFLIVVNRLRGECVQSDRSLVWRCEDGDRNDILQ